MDDGPECCPHGDFDQTHILYRSGQGKDLGSLRTLCSDGSEPSPSISYDGRDIGEGLHIIQNRRLSP